MIQLDLTDVLAIAAQVWDEPSDVVVAGSDLDAIDEVLAEAKDAASFGDVADLADLADVAGALLTGLVARRPFPRRNRRIAVTTVLYFLSANGHDLDLESSEEVDELLDELSTGSFGQPYAASWLRSRLRGREEENEDIPSYERLSARARHVLALAREAAGEFQHDTVDTEHILLALLSESEGIAGKALRALALSAERVRQQLEQLRGRGRRARTSGGIPLTASAERLVKHAAVAADRLRHAEVGTEHLLLGLIREGEGLAADLLSRLGVAPYDITQEVFGLLGRTAPQDPTKAEFDWREGQSMFERFNDEARRVVVLAQENARMLGHNYIGTEHVLIGVAQDGENHVGSVAGEVLQGFRITPELVRTGIEVIIGRGQQPPSGHIPFTPRAKKVLELGLREALQLGDNYIGSEHLLLGLVREGEGVAAQVLVKYGAELDKVRERVLKTLRERPDAPWSRPGWAGLEEEWSRLERPRRGPRDSGPRRRRTLREIEQLYDENDLLRGENERLRGILRAHGLDADQPDVTEPESGTESREEKDVNPEDDDD